MKSICSRSKIFTLICLVWVVVILPEQAGARGLGLDPSSDPPVFIAFGPTIGGAPAWAPLRVGFSGAFIFRPAAATQLMRRMYAWNTGIILHGEYRSIDAGRDMFSATFVFRKYINNMRSGRTRVTPFAGAGGGMALASYTTGSPPTRAENRYFSFLAEAGYEFTLSPNVILITKAQWRNYIWKALDYSNWTLHVQVGIPIPW